MKKLAWLNAALIASLTTVVGCTAAENTQKNVNNVKGVTLIETVEAKPNSPVIPYGKYELDNGLTVILHEDHSDPLVHIDVTYHVGSARDEPGKTGFAHLFEHMMFKGSAHVKPNQHAKLITEAGGRRNGTTNTDRTNYYQTVPANQLEKVLWLESDRMGFFVDSITEERFEIQRDTVKNERGQRYDNKPYGLVNERIIEALYPLNHPYSWSTIGYVEDLNRVNVNDLKSFFSRWYGPNNATLTIGGDFDSAEVLPLIVKYFSEIPEGEEVKKQQVERVVLTEDRYVSLEDNIHIPMLKMTLPSVEVGHVDEAPLDVLSMILGWGKTSMFYKSLVEPRIALNANVQHPCAELACRFTLTAMVNPRSGQSLADIEKIMRANLAEFEARGVEADDLIKIKAWKKTQSIMRLQSVRGKVSTLAYNEIFTDSPNYIEKDLARYSEVTEADVMRVYKKYIKNKPAVILSVVPKGKLAQVAAADNFKAPKREFNQVSTTTLADLLLQRTPITFDRSVIPAVKPNKAVEIPEYKQSMLANGIEVLTVKNLELPSSNLLLKIPAGHYYQSKEKAGLANLTALMLNESSLKRNSVEMSNELAKLGSGVRFKATNKHIQLYVNSLTDNLEATLLLANEKLLQPAFNASDFKRVKRSLIQRLTNAKKNPSWSAKTAYRELTQANTLGQYNTIGSIETVEGITLADVKAYYHQQVKPKGSAIIASSDLPEKRLNKLIKTFENWHGEGKQLSLTLPEGKYEAGVVYLVDKKNAPQSVIRVGKRSLTYDPLGEFYQVNLMNFALGRSSNCRINMNLREDKGYTYGAGSSFWADQIFGDFSATAQVRSDVTSKALTELLNEIEQYAEKGIEQDELDFMKSAINQSEALRFEVPRAKLGYLSQIIEYDLSKDYVKQRNEIVAGMTVERVNALAKKHLPVDEMLIVIVGDASSLRSQLTADGFTVMDYQIIQ